MDILNTTSRKRETYEVQLEYSLLWECALGIAAVTNSPLIKTLERPQEYWKQVKSSISDDLLDHLATVEEKNTWKSLLQLLHQEEFTEIKHFISYISELSETDLKYICLPFIGQKYDEIRLRAAIGQHVAATELMTLTKDNPFFPTYIEFICDVNAAYLKEHLIAVMKGWFEQVIKNEKPEEVTTYLKTDLESKIHMSKRMSPEALVEWATGGIIYLPEPSIGRVLLIPQYVYRPWNIEADIEGTKVFYYPIANESIFPNKPHIPNNFLVLRYKALGDEVRLRMIKLLYENTLTLQDITNELDIAKSTVHHHLKILRSARLVEIVNGVYCLKQNALKSLPKEMEQYLNPR
ncbi:helix-turn-helix transcriptional regulator [Paraliobacillus sp. X-1268]|uniref:ArsR/SmtB family transcription factor n=1 Tax=Paraliobacillus sp. X-1268 TaxID=2213193 RepID=UPI000E3CF9C4|nr:winged helix-turn-helix domain-containing protein [Paraliobacillus sp. X-1268]